MAHPSAHRLIPDCRVSVDNKTLEIAKDAALTRVEVDLDLDLFGQCVLTFNDPRLTLINGKDFASGTAVKVEMGFHTKLQPIFTGEVVALEPMFRRDMPPSLRVVCHQGLHRLALSPMTRAFNDVDDKEIATRIAQEHGLTAEAPSGTREHVVQNNVSDAAFLKRIASKNGHVLRMEGKKLVIGPPPKGAEVPLGIGEGLRKVKVRFSANQQVTEVTAHAWDPKAKKEIVAKISPTGAVGEPAKKFGKGSLAMAGQGPTAPDLSSAEAMAKGRLQKIAESYVRVEAEAIGDPRLLPGALVALDKLGRGVDGVYRVEKAVHRFDKHGYVVSLRGVRTAEKTPAQKAAEKEAKAPPKQAPEPEPTEFAAQIEGEAQGDLAAASIGGEPESQAAEAAVAAESEVQGAEASVSGGVVADGERAEGEVAAADEAEEAEAPVQTPVEEAPAEAEGEPAEAEAEAPAAGPAAAAPSAVAELDGAHFELDKSFALPDALPVLRGVIAFLGRNPRRKLLIVGHTDKSGDEAYNLTLSKERAEMVRAALRGDVASWYAQYQHRDAGKQWGEREDAWMLKTLGFLAKEPGAATSDEIKAALRAFQAKKKLPGEGDPTPASRKALVQDYLALRGGSNPAVDSAAVLPCGERHPKPGATAGQLRRVEIFLFDGEIKPAPSGCSDAAHPGCTAYDAWLKEVTGGIPAQPLPPPPKADDPVRAAQEKVDALKKKYAVSIVSRATWHARAPKPDPKWVNYPAGAPLPLTNIVVHHSSRVKVIGGGLNLTPNQIQDFDMDESPEHYSDITYHFVIAKDGKIYEGRAIDAVGAHAGAIDGNTDIHKDPDWGSVGIVLTGDFDRDYVGDDPQPAQLESLKKLCATLLLEYPGIKPQAILKHSEVKRSGPPKACPGKRLAPHVDTLRASSDLKEIEDALDALEAAKKKAGKP